MSVEEALRLVPNLSQFNADEDGSEYAKRALERLQ